MVVAHWYCASIRVGAGLMVALPESVKAYLYQTGIDRILDAYLASAATIGYKFDDAKTALEEYEASGSDDAVYDEDGDLVSCTRHSLDHEVFNASIAASVVREAFIMSIFHYWERFARGWTKLPDSDRGFESILKASKKKYAVSPELRSLNALNNILKHRNATKIPSLARKRPDLFWSVYNRRDNKTEYRLALRHKHVLEAIEIIRASGPRDQSK